ncbi:keratin, type I cytoskeletal 13-like [Salvelinus namaycush]|uniref:Keratin, type I cytoskeletal 13-like n=1 Tax=Salvelinus namaycush TaxID=8040 RepID=A0A8U0PDV6_SALNM|nr:keratin, type I cytoskeletal 13-like [Salvelinus namaycush]
MSLTVEVEKRRPLATGVSMEMFSPELTQTRNSFAALDPEVPAPSSVVASQSRLDPEVPASSSTALSPSPVASTSGSDPRSSQPHQTMRLSNTKTVLDIDNAKLAAEDFKMKYAKEQAMRMAVEADISGLRRVLGDMNLGRSDLEMHYEGLKDELIMLKRNHQEIALVKTHVGSQVNVSVDAAPSQDLNAAMTEIRKHYESVVINNRKELEACYQSKVSKSSLEGTLADTQKRYSAQLAGLQSMVTSLELQLSQLHANIAHNKQEYDMLLNLKTRLELEIAEYRRLLHGEDDSSTQVVTKTITVTQTIVDGKVMVLWFLSLFGGARLSASPAY